MLQIVAPWVMPVSSEFGCGSGALSTSARASRPSPSSYARGHSAPCPSAERQTPGGTGRSAEMLLVCKLHREVQCRGLLEGVFSSSSVLCLSCELSQRGILVHSGNVPEAPDGQTSQDPWAGPPGCLCPPSRAQVIVGFMSGDVLGAWHS